MKIEVIQKDEKYSDVIQNKIYDEFNSVEELLNKLKPKFYILCSVKKNGHETGYKSIVDRKSIAIGETYEKCLEAYFIQNNRWSYCNGINIVMDSEEDHKAYRSHFYGNGGIANYAKCGGDMW